MASQRESARARPRGPGVAFGVLSLVLLLVISVLALTQRTPPPPTIAEFAPQAVENITDAPSDQSSSSGRSGGDGGAGGGSMPDPTPVIPPPIDVPRVRKCVGDPPRQIEDPQSPPCVPYWTGDNGGATYKGVTRDTIRVASPERSDDMHPILEAFFNKRFELYGRKILTIKVPNEHGDDAEQRADATYADEQEQVFASTTYNGSLGFQYHQELARRKVLSVTEYPIATEKTLASFEPYFWQYPMGLDRMSQNVGQWTCARLQGRQASHAGDPTFKTTTRKFGIVADDWDYVIDIEPLKRELAACGIEPVVVRDLGEPATYENSVLTLKSQGVTTIDCLCLYFVAHIFARTASHQAYFPEWLLSTYGLNDENFWLKFWPSDQLAAAFGQTFRPRQILPEYEPSRLAQRESDPSSFNNDDPANRATWKREYRALLLLASGIQMAGPVLTPQTFQAGLHKTRFPNPITPLQAGSVGFLDGDHTMTDDGAEWWWGAADRGPYNGDAGTICYVDRGARRGAGKWIREDADPFFQQPCDSGLRPA